MGCCVHHKPEPLNLELVIKSDPRPCIPLPTDGFCDVSLDSKRSQVLDEAPSPLPSFSFMSADKGTRYFIEKVAKRNSEDMSINRSMLTEPREEGTLYEEKCGPSHGRYRSVGCVGQCGSQGLRREELLESGVEAQTMRIVRANLKCCE